MDSYAIEKKYCWLCSREHTGRTWKLVGVGLEQADLVDGFVKKEPVRNLESW